MNIRIEPNENLIAELKSIQEEVNMTHGGIEQQIKELSHSVANLIDALIDAEEGNA